MFLKEQNILFKKNIENILKKTIELKVKKNDVKLLIVVIFERKKKNKKF